MHQWSLLKSFENRGTWNVINSFKIVIFTWEAFWRQVDMKACWIPKTWIFRNLCWMNFNFSIKREHFFLCIIPFWTNMFTSTMKIPSLSQVSFWLFTRFSHRWERPKFWNAGHVSVTRFWNNHNRSRKWWTIWRSRHWKETEENDNHLKSDDNTDQNTSAFFIANI